MMERLLNFVRAAIERVRNDRRRQLVLILTIPAMLLTILDGKEIFRDVQSLGAIAIGIALGYSARIDHELEEERAAKKRRTAIEMNDSER